MEEAVELSGNAATAKPFMRGVAWKAVRGKSEECGARAAEAACMPPYRFGLVGPTKLSQLG